VVSVAEAKAGQGTPMSATLDAGIEALSLDEQITFTQYVRLVLPADGFVFWVKADLVSPSALCNAYPVNTFGPNADGGNNAPSAQYIVKGSLHYSTELQQNQDETLAVNRVVFSSEDEVVFLNSSNPSLLWVAEYDNIKFSFSSRGSFYKVADIFHYVGNAVYPDMATQLVDSADGFDSVNVVVSNSLPLWLALNGYQPPYSGGFGNPGLPLFPSFLVPQNQQPPWVAVHIDPASTEALSATPRLDNTLSQDQLVQETVELTFYGVRNFVVQDFVACVNQYTLDYGYFGIMNMPVPRDDKRAQVELGTLAQKKTVTFQINYYQTRIRDIARQLILEAVPTYQPNPGV